MTKSPNLIYAIGDIHGRADLLSALLTSIASDAADQGAAYRVIFLGDVIDRGPDSRRAMELVCSTLQEVAGSRLILGNHDEFLLRILDPQENERDKLLASWCTKGGANTLNSYGFLGYEDAELITEEMSYRFPDHIAVLKAAEDVIVEGPYAFVHAGIRPGLPFEMQSRKDLRWIREEFLEWKAPFEKIVVHGHSVTPSRLPEIHGNRIAIDTGAYTTGLLTAAVLDPSGELPARFLATYQSRDAVQVAEISANDLGNKGEVGQKSLLDFSTLQSTR